MNIYTITNNNDGSILFTPYIIDETKYLKTNNGNNILLTKINEIKNINDINNFKFEYSEIIECFINDNDIKLYKYKKIYTYIYEIINDGVKIIKNSLLNIKTFEYNINGYTYIKKIGLSVQGVDANKSLEEIINQCILNNISLKMKIKLKDKKIVQINI